MANSDKKELLYKELQNYLKYLYEEEKDRADKINSATSTYLFFITFAFTFSIGLLGWLYPDSLEELFSVTSTGKLLALVLFAISIVLLISSLIFTVLVLKVRNYERLYDPKMFAKDAVDMKHEEELFTSMSAHFVVASERNHQINNKKARYLSIGLQSYIIGLVLMFISILLIQTIK